jgi:hypothetical protein
MKPLNEIEKELWSKLEEATKSRDIIKISHLNQLAGRIEKIRVDLSDIEQSIQDDNFQQKINAESYSGKISPQRGNLPPDGTKVRFFYKKTLYKGFIKNGNVQIEGLGVAPSFSKASRIVTNTSRNGWHDWEIYMPSEDEWILAETWRRQS